MTMLTLPPQFDPDKPVRLKATRPLFANGKRMEVDEVFEVPAKIAAEVLATKRADFADQADRGLVYKRTYVG